MTKTIYSYDRDTKEYAGSAHADESPLEPGVFLIPAYATDVEPPAAGPREVAVFGNGAWAVVSDWRGVPLYSTTDGSAVAIDEIGKTPQESGATETAMPSDVHTWDGAAWALDQAKVAAKTAKTRAAAAQEIDETIAAIYFSKEKFAREYEIRERQAQEYKDAGYAGQPKRQVKAFAEATGMSNQAAADLVLQQSAQLRGALDALGELRMRKYELQALTTADAITARRDEIMAAVNAIKAQLG